MAIPKRKNVDSYAPHIYDETSDTYSPLSESTPLPTEEVPFSSVASGQTNVTTAGTRVVLGVSTAILGVVVRAKLTNTGLIYVGNSGVTSSNGYILDRGSAVQMDVDNLSDIYIDSSVSGEGVSYIIAIA